MAERTRATEEIDKAKRHLARAQREIESFEFRGKLAASAQLTRILTALDELAISVNDDSADVTGAQLPDERIAPNNEPILK